MDRKDEKSRRLFDPFLFHLARECLCERQQKQQAQQRKGLQGQAQGDQAGIIRHGQAPPGAGWQGTSVGNGCQPGSQPGRGSHGQQHAPEAVETVRGGKAQQLDPQPGEKQGACQCAGQRESAQIHAKHFLRVRRKVFVIGN